MNRYELSAIDTIWSGHDVQFEALESEEKIFVVYYGASLQLTLASCPTQSQYWTYCKLDTWVGLDSHNYMALGLDDAEQVHVGANMHIDPVRYRNPPFRTVSARPSE